MKKLSIMQMKMLHDMLIKHTGGCIGLHDEGMLESAVSAPFATFDGKSLYPSIEDKAAQLGYGIVKNHSFIDGNKRLGMLAMITILEINGIYLNYTDDELIKLGLTVADGSFSKKELLQWIIEHN